MLITYPHRVSFFIANTIYSSFNLRETKMSWTPERESKLRTLWKKGHTASQIAALIGETTRNAVIGKAHRLNLEARTVSKKLLTTPKAKLENNVKIKQEKLSRKARFKSLLLDKNFEPENPKKTYRINR